MKFPSVLPRLSMLSLMLPASALLFSAAASAHGSVAAAYAPAVAVRGELPPPPKGVSEIKFGEFFRMPVGPQGLEPTEKLKALNGKVVRLVGYMVKEDEASASARLILSPLPVELGDQDESLSDDLPPSAVFVHLTGADERALPYLPGLLKLTGTLEIGARDEADGRVSSIRLRLDAKTSKQILQAKPLIRTARK